VVGLSSLARLLAVPYPIVLVLVLVLVLVVGGAVLGFVPGMPEVRLNPNVVLVVFLPPLVYGAAFFANLGDIRANLRTVTLNSIGLCSSR
jgi:CPA1 family monovalent cation:H+ antiporter